MQCSSDAALCWSKPASAIGAVVWVRIRLRKSALTPTPTPIPFSTPTLVELSQWVHFQRPIEFKMRRLRHDALLVEAGLGQRGGGVGGLPCEYTRS